VTPNPVSVIVGSTQLFTATAYDASNNVIPGVNFTWATNVGSINAAGLFTAQIVPGIGVVTAINGSVTGIASVTVAEHSFQINLTQGWNLISIPLELSDTSINAVLFSINGKWCYAQYYDATDAADHWKTYATFKPAILNDLWNLDNTMGFWIYMVDAATLTVYGNYPGTSNILLHAGWNLVGYPSLNYSRTIVDVFAGTGYDMVEGINASDPYRTSLLPGTYIVTPGEGYWLHVPSDAIWTVTSAPPTNDPMSININPPSSEEEITGLDIQQSENAMENSAATQPDTIVNGDDNQEMSISQGPSFKEISGQASVLFLVFAMLFVTSLRIRKRRK
jgi:hypothetical protein